MEKYLGKEGYEQWMAMPETKPSGPTIEVDRARFERLRSLAKMVSEFSQSESGLDDIALMVAFLKSDLAPGDYDPIP